MTQQPPEPSTAVTPDVVRRQEILAAIQTQPDEPGAVWLYYWSSQTRYGTWFTLPVSWPSDEGERMLQTFCFDDSPDVADGPQPMQVAADDGTFVRVVSRAGDFTLAGSAALRAAFAATLAHLVDAGQVIVSYGAA